MTVPPTRCGWQVLAARPQDPGRPDRSPQAGRRSHGVPPRTAGRRRQPLLLGGLRRLARRGGLVGFDLRGRAGRFLPAQYRWLVPGHCRAQGHAQEPLVYFAEKHFPDVYPRLLRELYPGARELFLVRDFRDMIASMLAYNARKEFGDFGRESAQSDATWLDELRRGVVALRDAWRDRGEPGVWSAMKSWCATRPRRCRHS